MEFQSINCLSANTCLQNHNCLILVIFVSKYFTCKIRTSLHGSYYSCFVRKNLKKEDCIHQKNDGDYGKVEYIKLFQLYGF